MEEWRSKEGKSREVILLAAGLAAVAALPMLEQAPPSHSDLLKIILSANPEENDLALTKGDKQSVLSTKVEEQPQPQQLQEESKSQPQNPPQTQPQSLVSSKPQPQDPPQDEPQPQDPLQEEPQPQDSPQEEPHPQDSPQEEPQPQAPTQEEPQPQDPTQEEPQPQAPTQEEPQPQDPTQEEPQPQAPTQEEPQPQNPLEPQPQPQDPETDPSEGPYVSEGEVQGDESQPEVVQVWPLSPFIQVYPQEENLSYESEELEQDVFNPDQQMEMFPGETDEGYVVVEANEELPSLDTEGTFEYEQRMIPFPFNQEEPFLPKPEEPQMEPVTYDSDEEELSFEPKMDSFPFEQEKLPMEDVSVESQQDSFSHDSGEFLGPGLVDSFPLDEELLETEYEEEPHEMEEGYFRSDDYDSGSPTMEEQPDYDYGLNMGEDQLHWGGNMPSVNDDGPVEELYHESQDDSPVDLFSWLVPDYFDESLDYDEPPFITSYHDDTSDKDSFNGEPEMQSEPHEMDQIPYWEEAYVPAEFFDDSHLEDKHIVEDDTMEQILPEGTEEAAFETEDGAGDVSFADFYIPINDDSAFIGIPQEYPENSNSEDGGEELVPLNEEESFDDGLFPVEPQMKTYQDDEEQGMPDVEMFGDILFPEYPPFNDERSSLLWPAEDSNEDQTEYLGEDVPVTIFESQPTYVADVEPEINYPSLLDIMKREIVKEEQVDPWSGAKFLMMDTISNLDTEDDKIPSLRRDDVSDILENDAMNIIVFKENRKNVDDFPITPMVDDYTTSHEPQEPVNKYVGNQPTTPFWIPHGSSNQLFPKIYFSINDELLRRKTPTIFDHMNGDMSFPRPMPRRSLKTPIMRNPFTFLNEALDDDLPPQYLPSPSMSRRLEFMGPDTFSSPRNYPDTFKTPKFSFHDLLQQMNPSFYDNTYNARQNDFSPSYSSQSYDSLQQYDDLPHHFSYTSPPVPYSTPFESFQERDYSGVHNYYANEPRAFSFHTSTNVPLSLFREDTMSKTYPHQPLKQYDDYTDDLPFMPTNSFSSPRPRFSFYQRPQYSASTPTYRRSPYSYNNFYGNGPYHPSPIYPRYAPDFF
ncbi:cell surface glycoprotein 1-like isoform X2 [Portunus trituberculatus]|uniref:cell surface glycoprotein 1-like isoform X2 n=1 Tax=Portunus trituberculatus TaxID=210409 RepID=UPI001E1CFE7F|nr:cell surface glycoprotein 1-like isoform X2 [Portunus trituberculatus]